MRILITGICGFVGTRLAIEFVSSWSQHEIFGIDNLSRPGSEYNRGRLQELGVKFFHGDIRNSSDFDIIPQVDWVIDCAANPSVLAGTDGDRASSRQLMEHNLIGTINILEFCKKHGCGIIMLSTSRVYSLNDLCKIPVEVKEDAYKNLFRIGISDYGIREDFPTTAPISLYGSAKLASEALVLEYSYAFDFPAYINRCGVLAGSFQFGKPDQGIFSYWIGSWFHKKPLKYIGFGGNGHQVRDCLHPIDLHSLLIKQMKQPLNEDRIFNVSGGPQSAISLKNLSNFCETKFGPHEVLKHPEWRKYDVPYLVLDSSLAEEIWDWKPLTTLKDTLEEISEFTKNTPEWLELSNRN